MTEFNRVELLSSLRKRRFSVNLHCGGCQSTLFGEIRRKSRQMTGIWCKTSKPTQNALRVRCAPLLDGDWLVQIDLSSEAVNPKESETYLTWVENMWTYIWRCAFHELGCCRGQNSPISTNLTSFGGLKRTNITVLRCSKGCFWTYKSQHPRR